jgi:hypothetical protein
VGRMDEPAGELPQGAALRLTVAEGQDVNLCITRSDGSIARGSRRTACADLQRTAKIDPTGTKPKSLWRATAASPADAMQPQLLQSGAPPNWHGVNPRRQIGGNRRRRAAKMHSSGDVGRIGVDLDQPLGQRQLRKRRRSAIRSATARSRSTGRSRSSDTSPICGV